MATAAPITNHAATNAHSWLRRALAQFAASPAPAASVCPINNTIIDLRLLLRRVDHARREYPNKPEGQAHLKIDNPVALMSALGVAMGGTEAEEEPTSPWDDPNFSMTGASEA